MQWGIFPDDLKLMRGTNILWPPDDEDFGDFFDGTAADATHPQFEDKPPRVILQAVKALREPLDMNGRCSRCFKDNVGIFFDIGSDPFSWDGVCRDCGGGPIDEDDVAGDRGLCMWNMLFIEGLSRQRDAP